MDDAFSTSSIKHEKQVSSWASFPEDGMSVVHTGLFYHAFRVFSRTVQKKVASIILKTSQ